MTDLEETSSARDASSTANAGDGFMGFQRPLGRAGVRNYVLVLGINGLVATAARRIAQALPGANVVATPYGRGQLGPDKEDHTAQLIGLGAHPNVGATLLVGVDRPSAEAVAAGILARCGRRAEIVCLDDTHENALELVTRGVRTGGRMAMAASRQRREPAPLSDLFIGVECGHSDATSGLAGNPLAGALVDLVVDSGGSAVIGETLEWLGAEHALARRAASPEVAAAIVSAVEAREARVAALGVDLLFNNPGHENVRGGLSTIEEKSLGAIAKAGSRPIRSILGLAEPPVSKGLHVMDGPGFSPESLTGFAAAGAQLMLFTTGPGNSYCSLLAPTIKLTAHPDTAERLLEQIDFDGRSLLSGQSMPDILARALFAQVVDVASGTLTWGEVFGDGDECFARTGGSF